MRFPDSPIELPARMDRRAFLWTVSALAAASAGAGHAGGIVRSRPRFAGDPFRLGVASGDPDHNSVVLWTRLAPEPLTGGGMPRDPVEVRWRVAEDDGMRRVVRSGRTSARPEWAHSVHVEVEGLRPDRWYWYEFSAGDHVSPRARTRTMPEPKATPDRLRFAFASCQHYEMGLFTAYEHMHREELDLVVHLGDYIYEGAARPNQVRTHVGPELDSLDDYRNRYAQYRGDPHLRAVHHAVPWLVTWDDHEFDNNYADAISEEKGVDPADFLKRRARAYQVYWEHMPLRSRSLPRGPDLRLYRRVDFGRLAGFLILDTRQYRTDQPCGDGNKPPCPEVMDPRATLLGSEQRRWLLGELDGSPTTWNILAQQVMMARADRATGEAVTHSMDQWPGYEVERRRLLRFLHERRVPNPVVLTGDIHTNWANELIADFDGLGGRTVAAEFVGTSITSGGNGVAAPANLTSLYAENPFVKFHNAQRGYVRCEVRPGLWQSDYRTLEYVDRPGSPLLTPASFVIEAGRPRLQRLR